jgi:hypothetical protein
MPIRQFETIIEAVMAEDTTAIRGLGRYRRFIHIDVRPRTRLVRWSQLRPGALKA